MHFAFTSRSSTFFRISTRGLLLGVLLAPLGPAGCAVPNKTDPHVASAPATIEVPRSEKSEPLPLLPHPALAFADPAARVSIADIAERVTKSVVSVTTERESQETQQSRPFPFFQGPPAPERGRGVGSGVIVSADGVVLTNNHVVAEADKIRVATPDGREFSAELIGADERSDVAVLRLQGDVHDLTPIALGQSERLRLGDVVLAIGNPFGVGQTVTMGIVSAKGRADVGIADYEDFIQTDAAINPGNSGGALVDMEGNLVGINTAILSRSGGYQGIGFAIPTEMVRPIMDSLLQDGKVVRGYLGVGIQDLDPELQQALGTGARDGVLISSIEPGGAAERAGVERGDVVVAVDGTTVETTGRMRNAIAAKGQGRVQLEVLRNGQSMTLPVDLGVLPDKQVARAPVIGKEPGSIGVELAQLSPQLASQMGLDRSEGVVVTRVAPGSPAANAGLRSGDVLLEVERKKVASPSEVQKAVQAKKGALLILVERQGRTRYVAVNR